MKRSERKVRLAWRIVFILYIALLIYFLFFAEWFGRGNIRSEDFSYNLRPFAEIGRFIRYSGKLGATSVFLNIFGNIIGFIPIGFVLPVMSREYYPFYRTLLFGITLSVAVELIQLVAKVGTCDIDDIILNTLGTVIGYMLFKAIRKLRKRIIIFGNRNRRMKHG